MSSFENLWEELASCFLCRKVSDATPLAAVYRLSKEHVGEGNIKGHVVGKIGDNEIIEIIPNEYLLKKEYWQLDKFNDIEMKHSNAQPRQEVGTPIVIFNHEGINYVIDGNNRINKWRTDLEAKNKKVPVLIISSK